jgi:REP element-mobilizing transposase RayT
MPPLPLAYFITFRTYGTWLHGDARGSFQRRAGGWPSALGPMPRLERAMEERLRAPPVRLDDERRATVADTLREVCERRGWALHAMSVRLEHVHVVVTSGPAVTPEQIMTTFKAWSTRRLVERGCLGRGARVWSRHGSTRYVRSLRELETVAEYVEHQQ